MNMCAEGDLECADAQVDQNHPNNVLQYRVIKTAKAIIKAAEKGENGGYGGMRGTMHIIEKGVQRSNPNLRQDILEAVKQALY